MHVMRRLRPRLTLVLALAALLPAAANTGCATGPSVTAAVGQHVYPGADWQRIARPESVGWSSAGLDSVRQTLAGMSSTGFMAVVGGLVTRRTSENI